VGAGPGFVGLEAPGPDGGFARRCALRTRLIPIAEEGFLREADAGLPVKELCRKHGFSEPSYYAWKAKFGGMNVSDAQRLKALEAENNKLKMSWPPE